MLYQKRNIENASVQLAKKDSRLTVSSFPVHRDILPNRQTHATRAKGPKDEFPNKDLSLELCQGVLSP
jgi:hypothetical protein